MPRRRDVPKRKILPDPKFKDKLVAKFTNTLMLEGKKAVAEGALYGAFDIIQNRFKQDPLEVFRKALDNVKPKLEVKSRRVGGATYQVPVEVRQIGRAQSELQSPSNLVCSHLLVNVITALVQL